MNSCASRTMPPIIYLAGSSVKNLESGQQRKSHWFLARSVIYRFSFWCPVLGSKSFFLYTILSFTRFQQEFNQKAVFYWIRLWETLCHHHHHTGSEGGMSNGGGHIEPQTMFGIFQRARLDHSLTAHSANNAWSKSATTFALQTSPPNATRNCLISTNFALPPIQHILCFVE